MSSSADKDMARRQDFSGRVVPLRIAVRWRVEQSALERKNLQDPGALAMLLSVFQRNWRAGMKRVLVRYKLKPDRVAENENLVRKVFEQLAREKPAGLRYASYKLDDGLSFVHLVEIAGGGDPLPKLSAFKAFIAEIEDRCEEQPVVATLKEVGSYVAEK